MATASSTENDETAEVLAKPPFLRRVRIRGYKSIAFCDVTLEPLTILVGRNASGKSNFLDALAFLRDVLAKGVLEAVSLHQGRKSVLPRTSRGKTVSISIEVNYQNPITHACFQADYGIEVKLPPRAKPVVLTERVRIFKTSEDVTVGFDRRDEHVEWIGFNDRSHPLVDWCSADRLMLGVYGNSPFFELSVALHDARIYNFSPEAIRELRQPGPAGIPMEKNGGNLASVIESIEQEDKGLVRRIETYLRATVPNVEGFHVARYGEYGTVRFRLLPRDSRKPIELDAASMSDGTLRALAALVAAFQIQLCSDSSVIGIEEPETALHPAAMRALVAALDEASLRTQVLLTTHSPDLLDAEAVKPKNVRFVEWRDGSTAITPLDEVSVGIVRDQLNTLGGLERDRQLGPNLDDLDRQDALARRERDLV